jgi:hypothetical protein
MMMSSNNGLNNDNGNNRNGNGSNNNNVFDDHEFDKRRRFRSMATMEVRDKVLGLLSDKLYFQEDYHAVAIGKTPSGRDVFGSSYFQCRTPREFWLPPYLPYAIASTLGDLRIQGNGNSLTVYYALDPDHNWWVPAGCILARTYPAPGRRLCYNRECLAPDHVYSCGWSAYRKRLSCPGDTRCECPAPTCIRPGPTFVINNTIPEEDNIEENNNNSSFTTT